LELLVGLLEGCKEISTVSSALQSATVLSDELILTELLGSLGWTGPDPPVDLTRHEFTLVDWDDVHTAKAILSANVMFRAWRCLSVAMRRALSKVHGVKTKMAMYLSPVIIQRELEKCKRLARNKTAFPSLTVRVLHSSTQCQVSAEYSLDAGEPDARLSVSLLIPADYPLTPVHIDLKGGRQGLSESRYKAACASTIPTLSSTADLAEALRLWAGNLERQLGGVEPCSICYCVLCPTDRTVPTPACKTCRNKFHSACLYKWFRTGGQATCPMCRSLF
jgi:hypothetical protein